MKTVILAVAATLMLFSLISLQAACPTGDITLNSQLSINNFSTDYPGCTVMPFSITIDEAVMGDIINLDGLSALTAIVGNLIITNNAALNDISGLSLVGSIGGELIIENNAALPNLSGLGAVLTIGGSLAIGDNAVLTDLMGLSGLTSIGGVLLISFNDALTSLSGLENITSIPGYLRITHNNSLSSLAGLNAVTSIGDYFQAEYNPSLTSIAGFNSLTTVGSNIFINNNFGLTSIAGLGGLASIPGTLLIYLNPVLTGITGFGAVTSIDGDLEISNNATLTNISGLNMVSTISGTLKIDNNDDLTSMSGLSAVMSIGGDLQVSGNESLTNLFGLGTVTAVAGSLLINGNFSLSNITNLAGITAIGGTLSIASNEALTSLNGLQNISPTSLTNLVITFNPLLSTCEVQSICDYLAIPGSTATINDNAMGCATRVEVEAACLALPAELVNFDGKLEGHAAHLNWQTASEVNNDFFLVEKSDDGWHWMELGKVNGNGTTTQQHTYYFADQQPVIGLNYYRLRQVDFDGKEAFSKVVVVNVNPKGSGLFVHPNPATDELFLKNMEEGKFDALHIFDGQGRVVFSTNEINSTVPVGQLQPGLYYLRLAGRSGVQTLDFLKD
ncbi:MAG: T9SS type A sorting domain-containing protein [Bacteroidetes bacterium]|nr:T9SS type A sorting domain-containing protein [Bacteroidota bacterium]